MVIVLLSEKYRAASRISSAVAIRIAQPSPYGNR